MRILPSGPPPPRSSLVTLEIKCPKQKYKDGKKAQGSWQPAQPGITSSVPMAALQHNPMPAAALPSPASLEKQLTGRVGQQKVGPKTFVRELSKNDRLLKEMKWHLANYNRAVNKSCQSAQMAARALQSRATQAGNWQQVNTGGRPRTSLLGRMTSREGASSSIGRCQKIRDAEGASSEVHPEQLKSQGLEHENRGDKLSAQIICT